MYINTLHVIQTLLIFVITIWLTEFNTHLCMLYWEMTLLTLDLYSSFYLQFYPSGCSHCSYYSNRGKNKKFCPPGQLGKFWWNISGLEWSLLVYLLLRYADEKKISKIRWPRGQTLFEFDLNLSTIKFAWSGPAGECLFQPLSIARWYIFKDMIFICQKISKPHYLQCMTICFCCCGFIICF